MVAIALLFLKRDQLFLTQRSEVKPKISAGLRYVGSRPDIIAVMVTVFFAATFGLNFQIFNALVATKIFNKDAGSYGALGSILAIGSLSAALISAKLDRRRHPKFIISFAIIFGVSLFFIAFMPTYLAYAILLPLCGFLALTTMISANSYVQVTTDSNLRGRVMGLYLLIFLGGTPIGSPLIGWFSDQFGIRESLAICGAVTALAPIATYFFLREKLETFYNYQESNAN